MGFFDRFRSRPPEDYADVAESAGFMMGTAASKLRRGEVFAALVLSDPLGAPRLFDLESTAALAEWAKVNGRKVPRYVTAVPIESHGMPAVRVTAVDPGPPEISVTVTARYYPHSAPAGFEVEEKMDLESSGDPELLGNLQMSLIRGLSANNEAGWLFDAPDEPPAPSAPPPDALWVFNFVPHDPKGRVDLDQDTGLAEFRDAAGQLTARARYQFIGTYSRATHTVFWAWANPSCEPRLCTEIARLRDLAGQQGPPELGIERVPCDEARGDQLLAHAAKLMQASAWYAAPISQTAKMAVGMFQLELTQRS